MRIETPAGGQGQVDFGTFDLPWGRRHELLVVLGDSRLLWLRFYRFLSRSKASGFLAA